MEESWFEVICDAMGIAGNLAECIGVVFLFSQLRRTMRIPFKRQRYEQQRHQQS